MQMTQRLILEEYRKSYADFVQLEDVVGEMLRQMVGASGIKVFGVQHRLKSEKSLAGKLERSGDYYQRLDELKDVLGARIICYFNDDVDKLGRLVEQTFDFDAAESSDKRALINASSFGYLSLHYVCSLPRDAGYPDALCDRRFEIQIRTVLQHTWASIEHDLGYKTEFGLPREYERAFSRIASLLEIADDEFIRARDGMRAYTAHIRQQIADNCAVDVPIDSVSLTEYVARNKQMLALLQRLSDICGAEIKQIDPESYIRQLAWFGIRDLGSLQSFVARNFESAYALAEQSLRATDLDILTSSVGLYFLCRSELLAGNYTEEQAADFLRISTGSEERARQQAARLFAQNKTERVQP